MVKLHMKFERVTQSITIICTYLVILLMYMYLVMNDLNFISSQRGYTKGVKGFKLWDSVYKKMVLTPNEVKTRLHEKSTLSPYLFTLVLKVLTEHIQEIVSQCIFFVDNIVLVEDSNKELNGEL
ncbi:hypothetical protein Lal_00021124 [Lupinus albus]|nr:hypothetical protein Lal_00021124 [Lupinus albus]